MAYGHRQLRVHGERAVGPDGAHATPESEPAEYGRVALVDRTERQARAVQGRPGESTAGRDRG